jgi:hypothetical protein
MLHRYIGFQLRQIQRIEMILPVDLLDDDLLPWQRFGRVTQRGRGALRAIVGALRAIRRLAPHRSALCAKGDREAPQ